MNNTIRKYMSELGKKGAKITNANMTKEQRIERAKLGAVKRWSLLPQQEEKNKTK